MKKEHATKTTTATTMTPTPTPAASRQSAKAKRKDQMQSSTKQKGVENQGGGLSKSVQRLLHDVHENKRVNDANITGISHKGENNHLQGSNLPNGTGKRTTLLTKTNSERITTTNKHSKAKQTTQPITTPQKQSNGGQRLKSTQNKKSTEQPDMMLSTSSGVRLNSLLAKYGLDSLHNYAILASEYFLKEIDGHYFCILCPTYKRVSCPTSIDDHLESRQHITRFLELRSCFLQTIPNDNSLNSLAIELLLNSWIESNSLTDDARQDRSFAISELCHALTEINPECTIRIIGSFFTGSSLVYSDINVELLHPTTNLFETDPRAKNSIHHKLVDPDGGYGQQYNLHTLHYDLIDNASVTLYKLSVSLSRRYSSITSFNVISTVEDLNSKMPELALKHEPTGINLRLCCYAESSYRMACLLRNYLSLDERAVSLSILVKHWARICRISEAKQGTLSADTIVILMIHFLQRTEPPVLPCLHEILAKNGPTKSNETTNATKENLEDESSCDTEKSERNLAEALDVESLENNLDTEVADEEDEEDDGICNEFDTSLVENLQWSSQNESSVHKLFIQFLKFSFIEFSDIHRVISIRTLKKVPLRSKGWNTEVKAIENPVRPKTNLSRTIASRRTYDYIRQCFAYAYYYLTSLPSMNIGRKHSREPESDPSDYSELYVNLKKLDFYFNMRQDSIRTVDNLNTVKEMIQQDLFARDINVVQDLFEFFSSHRQNFDLIPRTIANNYNVKSLIPPDVKSTVFCWMCRKFGHSKSKCPEKSRDMFLQDLSYDDPLDMEVNFDHGFVELYTSDMITPDCQKKHNCILQQLTRTIRVGTGLNCRLTLFGSTVNLLGSLDSDLDICMTIEGNLTGRGVDCADILMDVCALLSNDQRVENMEPVLSARVPIIKFKYDGYDVDLSMYNQCAIHNSRLLLAYVLIDLRFPQLFYLVKRYAKACDIADASKGSLSSYAWSLMVIHFLQRTSPPILPVLQEPADGQQKPTFGVNGWNVWFNENVESISMAPCDTNLTTLFKQFLLYYSRFDFYLNVISIRSSRMITKFQKNWTGSMIAIEDPFELTYNLAGRLDDPMAFYIIRSFSEEYKNICRTQNDCLSRNDPHPRLEVTRKIFEGKSIMDSPPPYRGCRLCHRIGHRIKDCPERQRIPSRQTNLRPNNRRGRR